MARLAEARELVDGGGRAGGKTTAWHRSVQLSLCGVADEGVATKGGGTRRGETDVGGGTCSSQRRQ